MRFRYIGEEYSEFMGFKWMTGTEHDVADAHAIKKLSGSVLFEKVDGGAAKLSKAAKAKKAEPETSE
jgi:hypothetical protein